MKQIEILRGIASSIEAAKSISKAQKVGIAKSIRDCCDRIDEGESGFAKPVMDDLRSMSPTKLQEMAKSMGVRGWQTMPKSYLIAILAYKLC